MNRKGESVFAMSTKMFFWIFLILMISLAFIFIQFMYGAYKSNLVYTPLELKSELISLRFSNTCFNSDGSANLIELDLFTEENLDSCYLTSEEEGFKDLNFRLKLDQSGEELKTNKYYHNDDHVIRKKVLVSDAGKMREDMLFVFVQQI